MPLLGKKSLITRCLASGGGPAQDVLWNNVASFTYNVIEKGMTVSAALALLSSPMAIAVVSAATICGVFRYLQSKRTAEKDAEIHAQTKHFAEQAAKGADVLKDIADGTIELNVNLDAFVKQDIAAVVDEMLGKPGSAIRQGVQEELCAILATHPKVEEIEKSLLTLVDCQEELRTLGWTSVYLLRQQGHQLDTIGHEIKGVEKKIDVLTDRVGLHSQAASARPADNLDLAGVTDNPNFVGRDDDLKRLEDALTTSNVAITHALTGEGGIGKTELARAYADRNRHKFAGVWWLEASDAAINHSIAEVFKHRTGKEAQPGATPDQIRADFLRSLPEGDNLLILDNVESPEVFGQFRLKTPSRVLATAQRDFGHLAGVSTFDVRTISEDAGIELILKAWQNPAMAPSKEAVRPIVRDDLACHTYAVDLARSYFARFPATTPPAYREMLATHGRGQVDEEEATEAEDKTGRGYRKSVRLALLPHLDRLKETKDGQQALKMLELAAFCHPNEIPIQLLADAMAIDLARANALLELLGQGAMLTVSKLTGHASMHRLAQSILRRGLTEEQFAERALALTKCFALLYRKPHDVTKMGDMRAGLLHLFHFAEVLGTSPHPRALRQAFGPLGLTCSAAASFACRISAMQDAERLGIGAVFLASAAGPKYSSKSVIALASLSLLAKAQGNVGRASWLIDQANEMVRARMPDDKYLSAVLFDARAQIDYTANRFRHAAAGHARAISLLRSLNTDQFEVQLAVWSNYAATQIELERYDRALQWINKVLVTASTRSAQPDVHIARAGRHGATIEAKRGNFGLALDYARQSLAAEVRRGGEESYGAAHCHNLIGGLLVHLGRGQEAIPEFVRSLEILVRSSTPLSEGVVGNCWAIAQASGDWENIVRHSLHDLPPDVREDVIQATKNRLSR